MSASIEFFVFVTLSLLIVMSLISYSGNLYISSYKQKVYNDLENIAEFIANEINIAASAGDGYVRIFFMNSKGYNFSVEINDYLVRIFYENFEVNRPIYVKNVGGTIKLNKNNLIKNVEGNIFIQ
ncbi:MAG: hypothetical protein QW641_01460 [Candidatus Aenigmatarchaeota archaeon]